MTDGLFRDLEEKLQTLLEKPHLIILTLFLIAGTITRFYGLGVQSVWFDESISAIAGRSLLENGSPVLPSGNYYGRAILHTGFAAVSFKVFGLGTAAGRVPSAVLGVLSIPVAYLLGSRIKNHRVGILLAFFLTFTTVQIAWSRQIRFYQQLQFFFLVSLYFFERLLDEMDWRNFSLVLIFGFCMTVSHDAFGYLLAIPIVFWFFFEKFEWIKERIHSIDKIRTRDWIGISLLIGTVVVFLVVKGFPLGNLQRLLSWNVKYTANYTLHFLTEIGPLLYLVVPGAIIGTLKRSRNLLYVFSLLIPLYVVSFRVLAIQHRYVFMLFPLLFLFIALFLDYIYEKVGAYSKKYFHKGTVSGRVIPIIIVVIIVGIMIPFGNYTFTSKTRYDLGWTAPQGEFRPAYGYVENHWGENDVIISTLTPITWYYLQRSDYWISFSHWGLDTYPDRDGYTGAETIKTVEELRKVEEKHRGWVVIDKMGNMNIKQNVLNYIHNNFEHVQEASGEGVWVYRWK